MWPTRDSSQIQLPMTYSFQFPVPNSHLNALTETTLLLHLPHGCNPTPIRATQAQPSNHCPIVQIEPGYDCCCSCCCCHARCCCCCCCCQWGCSLYTLHPAAGNKEATAAARQQQRYRISNSKFWLLVAEVKLVAPTLHVRPIFSFFSYM